jgi:hypothetical protein
MWVQGQRKMIQVLGVFGLLNFTTLRPFSLGAGFGNLLFPYLSNFFSGHSKPRITETADNDSADMEAQLYCLPHHTYPRWLNSSLTLLWKPHILRVTGISHVSFPYIIDNHINRNLTATVARILFVTVYTIYITAICNTNCNSCNTFIC